MIAFARRLFAPILRIARTPSNGPRRVGVPLRFDALEDRSVPAAYAAAGPAVQANNVTAGSQQQAQIAVDGQNRVTVVWADDGLDSSGFGIYARRLTENLTPVGNQFRANTRLPDAQDSPGVGVNAAGTAVIAWREQIVSGFYALNHVRGQRYNSSGTAQGGNLDIRTQTNAANGEDFDREPVVHVWADGSSAIGWAFGGAEESGFALQYRVTRYTPAGVLAGESAVNLPDMASGGWTFIQRNDWMRFGPDGTLFIPWSRYRAVSVPDVGIRYNYQGYVTRISPAGTDLGDTQIFSTTVADYSGGSDLTNVTVAPLADGGFVAAYSNASRAFVGRRYSGDGTAQGSAFTVIPASAVQAGEFSHDIQMAALSDGNVAATWIHGVGFDNDTAYFRIFTATGAPVTDPILIPEANGYYQATPRIAPDNAGGFYTVWADPGGIGTGVSEVMVKRYVKLVPPMPALAGGTVPEFRKVGTFVGTLSAGPAGRPITYTLVSGTGSTDNAKFTIAGDQLRTATAFDAAAKTTYSVRVRATDTDSGLTGEAVFAVTVTDDPNVVRGGRALHAAGSAGNDVFSFFAGTQFHDMRLNGADLAVPVADVDTVVFYGGAGTNTAWLVGRGMNNVAGLNTNYGVLTGTGYTVWVTDTREILAQLPPGADGIAYLAGTAGTETYTAYWEDTQYPGYPPTNYNVAQMTGTWGKNATIRFGTTVAYSGGGADVANLTGSPGNDQFVGTPTYSLMTGPGFYNVAADFKTVTAVGDGGSDAAFIADSTGNDTVNASGNVLTLNGPAHSIRIEGFAGAIVYGFNGGTNKKTVGPLSFYLELPGVWVG